MVSMYGHFRWLFFQGSFLLTKLGLVCALTLTCCSLLWYMLVQLTVDSINKRTIAVDVGVVMEKLKINVVWVHSKIIANSIQTDSLARYQSQHTRSACIHVYLHLEGKTAFHNLYANDKHSKYVVWVFLINTAI